MDTTFKCRNGSTITIRIDEFDDFSVTVFDEGGIKLGQMNFSDDDGCLKLTWAYLDQSDPVWCRQGIGQEILRQVKEVSGCPIVASDNDGIRHDDGSHLTGDAPGFVARMREEGLIEPGSYDRPDENEDDW